MSPGPWKFHQQIYGLPHVIVDANGSKLASHILIDDGPMMAAAPALLGYVLSLAQRQDEIGASARVFLSAHHLA